MPLDRQNNAAASAEAWLERFAWRFLTDYCLGDSGRTQDVTCHGADVAQDRKWPEGM